VLFSENIRGFSAVCFLFGRNLYRKYGRPVGMIESSFGGTRIEAWMSEETLPKCFNSIVLLVFTPILTVDHVLSRSFGRVNALDH